MEGGQPTWDLVRNREATDLWEHHKQKERNHVGTSLPRMVRSASIYLLFAERSHKLISLFQIGKQMKYVGAVLPGMISAVPLHGCLAEHSYKVRDKMPPSTTSPILNVRNVRVLCT